MTVRIYLRRSKNDEGKQQFSLDVQRHGCHEFARRFDASPADVLEYVDDGKAGDDFHSRVGIRRLVADVQPGDIIICRDQSRLGRDAIEVTLVIRDLVRDNACRIFYYTTGQEVQFANAIDQATTFIQGTGHQMELEAIRSRTREALRSRVREGRVAGGRCYGYTLERRSDASGRGYTVAVVDDKQAEVVRRIYREYLSGRGLKSMAIMLNDEGVPSPTVGRRGRGTWAPTGIREMLRNPRYCGLYVHGRVKKVRHGGKVRRVKADPSEVISVDIPEWRIVNDDLWLAVQDRFASRKLVERAPGRPNAVYPLTGIARCGSCGGSIGKTSIKRSGGQRVPAYACTIHHHRGNAACGVSLHQEAIEVEGAILAHLQDELITPEVIDKAIAEIRIEVEAELKAEQIDTAPMEAELRSLRSEQRKLASAIAVADDVPELLSELKQRQARIKHLEEDLEVVRRTPELAAQLMAKIEAHALAKLHAVREAVLDDRAALRDLFRGLFPEGLTFEPETKGTRQVWAVSGRAHLGGSTKNGDPTGT